MSNNSNPNYFRLGVFVLAAIGVLITVILIFGSGQFFKKSFTIETYLKQSVTGLDTGAAVRFRGDRKSTRLNSSHITRSRMPSSA